MAEATLYYEDFPPGLRLPLGPFEVTAQDIIDFARQFDPQPMHLSREAGEASILGGLAASGWHTCAMLMRMMFDSYISRSSGQGAPGIDSMEWKRPVLAGDILSGFSEVEAARPLKSRPGIGMVTCRHELVNQRGETVLVARNASMIRQKSTPENAP
ncbi:MaoC family dehydratase [Allorhizobium undicola]|uniref:MaoC family dehydratase n=1 Tax=Allorhizobium undicola TaxID=78527 RepID=UPI00048820A0|nr:MaoC family dehydratase [Allorhizobium undicola]